MRTRLLALIAICLLPVKALSGPDETTQHLMNDSATMLDFGMLRLNLSLEAATLANAYFDWDENRIYIWRYFQENETADVGEETCSQWIGDVRLKSGVNRDTGKPFEKTSLFAGYFAHHSFKRNSAPETLYQDIDKLFVLRCTGQIKGGGFITIFAPLLGSGYSLEK